MAEFKSSDYKCYRVKKIHPGGNIMTDELKVFLPIGQSNMAGRGRLDEVPELVSPQVFMFRAGRWLPAVEPLHTDKPQIAGVGLGMSFALELTEKAGIVPVGLVPCAVGGTPLSRWMPGADLYEKRRAGRRRQGGGRRGWRVVATGGAR
jgi:hypothetical protein